MAVLSIKILAILIPLCPRKLVDAVGQLIGWVGYYFLSERRIVAHDNLDLVFGTGIPLSARKRIAQRSFINFARTLMLLFWSSRLNASNLYRYVEIDPEGLDVWRRVTERSKGVVALSLHLGDWEVLGLLAPLIGYPQNILMEHIGIPGLDKTLCQLRSSTGNQVFSDPKGLIQLRRSLERGECATMLCDLNAKRGHGVWVDFFNIPVFNHYTPAALARRTGAPIIFGVAVPRPNKRTLVTFQEIPYNITDSESDDLRKITQRCSDFCERVIRQNPDLWHWSYKRWKRRKSEFSERYPSYARHKIFFEARVFQNDRKDRNLFR